MSTERERFDEVGQKIKREADGAADPMGNPVGTLNTIAPCAACKLLRRRCAQECPFSPYFPPHEPQKFASVHKVFGASNVSKMLMEVPKAQRADAANSLVFEANMRLRDPVYGCMGAILALQRQVQALETELQIARAEILKLRYRQATVHALPASHAAFLAPGDVPVAAPPSTQTPPLPTASAASSSSSSIYITPSENVTYFG